MKRLIPGVLVVLAAAHHAGAQPATKIPIVVEARSEGQAGSDTTAARLLANVRRGLEALGDVELVPAARSRRMSWIVAGTTAGVYAASMMVTERYDRETLMVL